MPFLKMSSALLALAVITSLVEPALAGDYHGSNRGFARVQGPRFGAGHSNFNRDHRFSNRDRFAAGHGFRFDQRNFGGYRQNGYRHGGRNGSDFAGNGDNFRRNAFRSNRPQRLYSTNAFGYNNGSSVNVILRDQSDYGYISNYAGSTDVYHTRGGTYATGYSFGSGQTGQNSLVRQGPKIIDVARMRSACSNENGVCVIRP